MAFWHIPALFNAALSNEPLHIVEHLSLLVGGTIYWWPILAPLPRVAPAAGAAGRRLSVHLVPGLHRHRRADYLRARACSIPHTRTRSDTYGILPIIRQSWGISPAMDQQIGGLLMWVPGCLVYSHRHHGDVCALVRRRGEASDGRPVEAMDKPQCRDPPWRGLEEAAARTLTAPHLLARDAGLGITLALLGPVT